MWRGQVLLFVALLPWAFTLTSCSKSSSEASTRATEDNSAPPIADPMDLQGRANDLFQAVVKDDPARAETFWFPREPFVPLKEGPEPGAYWEKLHRAYADDIHIYHAARSSWDGAAFDRFELGTAPRWMKPGDEHNRIGYYSSLGGSIHYRVGEKMDSFVVDAIITWQGHWYVTHLRRVRK